MAFVNLAHCSWARACHVGKVSGRLEDLTDEEHDDMWEDGACRWAFKAAWYTDKLLHAQQRLNSDKNN
jgi:hypothetical protein